MNIQRMIPTLLVLLLIAAPTSANEIGLNDQRVSFMGVDGDPASDAKTPVMAYNPTDNQVLMVWSADAVDGHFQIWGQRMRAYTGGLAGAPFQISFSGRETWDAIEPDVVFNPVDLEYLVVWSSDVSTDLMSDGAEEIYGQRISRQGELVGPLGFRISDMGADDLDPSFDANTPAVAWNSVDEEYLVVWSGDDDETLVDGDILVFVQRLGSDGVELGVNDIATPSATGFDFPDPDVAHDPVLNQYFVVFEVFIAGTLGSEVGGYLLDSAGTTITPGGRFVSAMGPSTTDDQSGKNPYIHYDINTGNYLVAWDGDGLFNEEFEVFVRWMEPVDAQFASDQFRMSDMGNDGTPGAEALHPAIAYNSNDNTYMVAWHGDDFPGATQLSEPEVFGQLFDATLAEIGTNDFRLSDMGPDPTSPYEAASATVVYNPAQQLYLVGWSGDDDEGGMAVGEEETHLQRWGATATPVENKPGPRRLALHDNFPNPFNPSTTISFDVPDGAPMVSLRIYDASGRLVRTLVQSKLSAGQHQVQWQGRDDSGHSVASGVYHLKMEAGEFKSSRKMALVQ